jgi:hypothetical protein
MKKSTAKEIYDNAYRYHRKGIGYLYRYDPDHPKLVNIKIASVDNMAKQILLDNFPLDLCIRILICWTGEHAEVIYKSLRGIK